MGILVDDTVERLERNYQHGYKHIDTNGKHWDQLDRLQVIEALDASLARDGINDTSIFLRLLYRITAHQTYHLPIDEKSTLTYHGIEQMLNKGLGNPRLEKLENLLNALGASLAICSIQDRDDDVEHHLLQRACFYQDMIAKERWPFRDTIILLFEYGLQYRIFAWEDVTKYNTLSMSHEIKVCTDDETRSKVKMNQSVGNLLMLLRLFNLSPSVRLTISPPTTKRSAK